VVGYKRPLHIVGGQKKEEAGSMKRLKLLAAGSAVCAGLVLVQAPVAFSDERGPDNVQLCSSSAQFGAMVTAPVSNTSGPAASGPGVANPAAAAVATGQWTYANAINHAGTITLSCSVPTGAVLTGRVIDFQGNTYDPATLVVLHATGYARTIVYKEYSV
jgi:hypothetical protein